MRDEVLDSEIEKLIEILILFIRFIYGSEETYNRIANSDKE